MEALGMITVYVCVWQQVARLREHSHSKVDGQGMAEYALIMAGVALMAMVAVYVLGPKIGWVFNQISASLPAGSAGGLGSVATP